ncbi:MAG: IS110 family transposase [Actinomycetota bacterium]
MKYSTTVVGLDVHKKTIVASVLPAGSEVVTERATIENTPAAVEKLVKKIAVRGAVEFVYEAGPCGYETHRQISRLGHPCLVIAPALTPVRPGDHIKTDSRDADKLARFHRAGELTLIRVPTCEEEAARDLPRAREDALTDRLRSRHRLGRFMLRQGRIFQDSKRAWTVAHKEWLRSQKFEWPALTQTYEAAMRAVDDADLRLDILNRQVEDLSLQEPYLTPVKFLRCLKGIDTLSALTLIVETQDFKRFEGARAYMSYTGAVGREHSSGERIRRGSITKSGNAHIRRILIESAWSYRRGGLSVIVKKRREGCPAEVVLIARKAEARLHRKFARMVAKNKPTQVAVTAVARELAGFIWSIAQHFPKTA